MYLLKANPRFESSLRENVVMHSPHENLDGDVGRDALRNGAAVAIGNHFDAKRDHLRDGQQDGKQPDERDANFRPLFRTLFRERVNDGRVTVHGDRHER